MISYRRGVADIRQRRPEPRIHSWLHPNRPKRSRWGVAIGVAGFTVLSVRSLLGLQTVPPSTPPATAAVAAVDSSAQSVTVSPGGLFDRPGLYLYAPDSGQLLIIERAIDQGVAHMFPLLRSFARARLKGTNKLPQTLQVVVTPDAVGTQLDAEKPMSLPRSGITVRWDNGLGDRCRAREIVVADTLMQLCAADHGASIARYVLEDSGETLRRTVHITSPFLGGPVDYALLFRRRSDRASLDPPMRQPLPRTRVVAEETPNRDEPCPPDDDP
jgi:hypothetical protein